MTHICKQVPMVTKGDSPYFAKRFLLERISYRKKIVPRDLTLGDRKRGIKLLSSALVDFQARWSHPKESSSPTSFLSWASVRLRLMAAVRAAINIALRTRTFMMAYHHHSLPSLTPATTYTTVARSPAPDFSVSSDRGVGLLSLLCVSGSLADKNKERDLTLCVSYWKLS